MFSLFLRRVFRPMAWRIGTRRLFLLTLPISLPVWIILVGIGFVSLCFIQWSKPLRAFWTKAPERNDYGYYLSASSKRKKFR
jgi:hypothetical protein